MLTFQVTGVQKAVKRLKGLQGKELERKSNLFLAKAVRGVVVPAVKAEERFKEPSGKTKRRTTARKIKTRQGEAAAYSVRARTPQAHLVIKGHRIVGPRPRRIDTGRRTAPNPFISRAARNIDPSALASRLGKELLK